MSRFLIVVASLLMAFNVSAKGFKASKTYTVDLEGVNYINVSKGAMKSLKLVYKKGLTEGKFVVKSVGESRTKADQVLNFTSDYEGDSIKIYNSNFNYSCELQTRNGKITKIKGGCLQSGSLTLPKGAKIEVYDGEKRLSKMFFPMTIDVYLEKLDDAFPSDEQLKVINEFVKSYKATKTKLELLSEHLQKSLDEFSFDNDKFTVLKKLHSYVTDRENLEEVIEDQFSYFDQEKARKIVGLPAKN